MDIAVVTGASSGLGREFVRQISQKDAPDEIWAVARRKEKLEELNDIADSPVRAIPLDLTKKESFDFLENLFIAENPKIKILVNAAGFGRMGKSEEIPRQEDEGILDLNCRAAVSLTDAALPYMNKKSRILQICSVAAFQPLPGLNTYAASKAFLMSYTKALHYELIRSGIKVTAVCPFWIRETEFIAGIKKTDERAVRHFPFYSKPPFVVRWALRDSRFNLWVSTPGPVATIMRIFSKITPHFIIVPLWDIMRRI
ncbi:MAG TPA: SDR family NAD(P)-dependent oxidoreductase [Bacillota bacterium]|nr:SDR family NAD(P)-dependent oxidoreductase [Bacillota bacterium]HUM56299.1 SDR family NAD(P)-dependent oxidoreductase [Bacillota bacterium]